ncbi:MAG: hypothetical protein M3Y27_09335 [Acidobacteriota bacterium]|nr:hypothetical protein [Acidobacteriota bacterium]
MNLAEKLAETYLRLNGFLLLPHFTTFMGKSHNHVDFVGLRVAGSQEIAFNQVLLTDKNLFKALSLEIKGEAEATTIGMIAEVRTNEKRDEISQQQVRYVQAFLGGLRPVKFTFFSTAKTVQRDGNGIAIGLLYAEKWINARITWMESPLPMSKIASWALSEDALADILARRRLAGKKPRRSTRIASIMSKLVKE